MIKYGRPHKSNKYCNHVFRFDESQDVYVCVLCGYVTEGGIIFLGPSGRRRKGALRERKRKSTRVTKDLLGSIRVTQDFAKDVCGTKDLLRMTRRTGWIDSSNSKRGYVGTNKIIKDIYAKVSRQSFRGL